MTAADANVVDVGLGLHGVYEVIGPIAFEASEPRQVGSADGVASPELMAEPACALGSAHIETPLGDEMGLMLQPSTARAWRR